MHRIAPLLARYGEVFEHYLLTDDEIAREQGLFDASEVGKLALREGPAVDQVLELHRQTQAMLAQRWQRPDASPAEREARERLVRGDATPLMLALMLPHEMEQLAHHERRWRREHETLAAMFEQTDDLIVILDADGLIDDVNPAFSRATGWSRYEAVAGSATLWHTPLPERGSAQVSAEQMRRDGSCFHVAWSVSPVLGRGGQLLSHVYVGRDVTRAQQVAEGLRENDKLRAVATLAGGIAHDFNNLLGSILGLAELCELEAAEGSRQARNLKRIREAGGKAAGLVRQMLDFSRQTPKSLQRMPASALLAHAEALSRAALPIGVSLVADVLEDGEVDVDLVQLEQVLLNITRNAAHAMRQHGGEIRITLDRADPASAVASPAAPPTRHVRLRVADRGEGIAPELLQKIFDPFFTTKPVGEGTGLGLAAVHGIVNSHGGVIEVDSTLGLGTTFSVFLPLAAAATPA